MLLSRPATYLIQSPWAVVIVLTLIPLLASSRNINRESSEAAKNVQALMISGANSNPVSPKAQRVVPRVVGPAVPSARIDEFTRQMVRANSGVTALSVAVIQDSEIVYSNSSGVLHAKSKSEVGPETVFRAASLSKPVFAYLVMMMAEEKVLDLDRPLYHYLDKPISDFAEYSDLKDDPRLNTITARMALTHTAGFPNWRWQNPDGKLNIRSDPGSRFSYSGEGYRFLQFVLEKITGKPLNQLCHEKVFTPLAMKRSSFILESRFSNNIALNVNSVPPFFRDKLRNEANAAGSLLTTAPDYARFLIAAMDGEGLGRKSYSEMLRAQVRVHTKALFGAMAQEITQENEKIALSWALGWGRFKSKIGDVYFHVGAEDGFENYTVYFSEPKIGLVLLSSGPDPRGTAKTIANELIGDTFSPFNWMGY